MANRPVDAAPPDTGLGWKSLGSVLVVLGAVMPNGPLSLFPGVLRIPLLMGVLVWWWRPRAIPWSRLEAPAVAWVLTCWGLLKLIGLHPTRTDDAIYLYLAQRVTEGAVPYRDFFFAHPPIHLLVPALALKVFGWSMLLGKLLPVFAQTASILCLWLAIRRKDPVVAFAVLTLQIVAGQILESSNELNGQDVMCAFAAASFFCATRERWILSGVLASLSLGSAFYGLAVVLTVGAGVFWTDRTAGARWLAGIAVTTLAWLLPFWGPAFVEAVFRYHTLKPAPGRWPLFGPDANPLSASLHNLGLYFSGKDWLELLGLHLPLFWAGGLGVLFVSNGQREGRSASTGRGFQGPLEHLVLLAAIAVGLNVLEYGGLNRVYSFYSVALVSFLCVPAAWLLVWSVRGLTVQGREGKAAVGLALAGCWVLVADPLMVKTWPDEGTLAGQKVVFQARPLWWLSNLTPLVEALFWSPSRTRGEATPAWQSYVWHKQQRLSVVAQLADVVRAQSGEGETVLGASLIAPLVALEAHRHVAADEADTNAMRFTSGIFSTQELWRRACADRVRLVIGSPHTAFDEHGLAQMPVVQRDFVRVATIEDRELLHSGPVAFTVYRRTSDAPCVP